MSEGSAARVALVTGANDNKGIEELDVQKVRDVVGLLYGASANLRLYGEFHPQTTGLVTRCNTALSAVLEWLGPLTLDASTTGLAWRGKSVAEESDDKSGLGRHLHSEGICTITMRPGIEDEELSRFLQVLRVNLSLPEYEEETLELLLWQSELPNVAFRAIGALMDAEALSGQNDDEAIRQAERLKSMMNLTPEDLTAGRALIDRLDSGRAPGLGDIVDQWGLSEDIDAFSLSDDVWKTRFLLTAGEDFDALIEVRDFVADERASQLLGRVARIMLALTLSPRDELPAKDAAKLAMDAVRQIYVLGDPIGLLEVLEHGHQRAAEMQDPAAVSRIRAFLKQVFSATRVAMMMRHLNPALPKDLAAIDKLAALLPDSALVTLFEGVRTDPSAASRAVLVRVLERVRDRVDAWMTGIERIPMEQALPIVFALQTAGEERDWRFRPLVLRHPTAAVRAAGLQWYGSQLPEADEDLVVACLFDKSPNVRDIAASVLASHRPKRAIERLETAMRAPTFGALDPDQKIDICVAYGRVAGPASISLLNEVLGTRTGLLADSSVEATLVAAAAGLAGLGTANALLALEKGARSLSGARRHACGLALDSTGGRRG
ncbi:MAG: hypothetical protein ACI81R_000127 [Bradymonadia bacterium]|jgi:hypothetical protein